VCIPASNPGTNLVNVACALLPHIAVLPARHPDLRETILQQQLQNQSCILPIHLLLAYSLAADHRRIPDPQLTIQFRQGSLEPACVPAGFHSHPYLLACQSTVEVLLLAMR
jgi:hypothetical protein